MRIILDGMGGDHAPAEIVKGAVETAALIDHEIVIVGKQEAIEEEVAVKKSMTWLAWVIIGLGAAGVTAAVVIETLNTKKKKEDETVKEEASIESSEE